MANLLVVDDDPEGVEVLCRFLEKSGHSVQSASNGEDALAAVIAQRPDLIVLDLLMPGLDGASLLQILRSYLRLQSMPVVVLTALSDGDDTVDRVRSMNVKAVLTKSKATLKEIQQAIADELQRVKNNRAVN